MKPTLAQQDKVAFRAMKDATYASRPSSSSAPSFSGVEVSLAALWISFNICVLILVVVLTIFLMRCVK